MIGTPRVMNLAIVGTGFVADMYMKTLRHHPELKLVGAFDSNKGSLASFCGCWPAVPYENLQQMLDDEKVELVLNLTNPRSHYEITRSCLTAGKHVYSEKPLAMVAKDAKTLVDLAQQKGLYLASAPCSLLSETAQTLWKAIREGAVGKVRVVYANFDDGLIAPKMTPWTWVNTRGIHWPAKDEFETGCTYEHAGYVLTWLAAFFGPAKNLTSFASVQIADKGIPVDGMAPDFTVGCLEYADGIVARVTCGLIAPRDKSLMVVGDDGMLFVGSVRNDAGPVYVRQIPSRGIFARLERRLNPLRKWVESRLPFVPWPGQDWQFRRKLPFARKPSGVVVDRVSKPVDFLRGPSELAEAIRENRSARLSANLGWHITELIERLQYPERFERHHKIESAFDPIQPLPW